MAKHDVKGDKLQINEILSKVEEKIRVHNQLSYNEEKTLDDLDLVYKKYLEMVLEDIVAGGGTFLDHFETLTELEAVPVEDIKKGSFAFVGSGANFEVYYWDDVDEAWVGAGGLPANILEALLAADHPSAENPFATLSNIPNVEVGNRVVNPGKFEMLSETLGEFIEPAEWYWNGVLKTFSGTVSMAGKPSSPDNRTDIVTASGANPVSQSGTPDPDPVTPTPTDPTHLVLQVISRPHDLPDVVNPVQKDPSTAHQLGQWLNNDGFTPMYAPIWRQTLLKNTYYDFMIAFVAFASDYSTVGQYPMNGFVMVDFDTKVNVAEIDPTRVSLKTMGIGNRNSDFVLAMSSGNQATLYVRKGAYIGNMTYKFVIKKHTVSDNSLMNAQTYGALPDSTLYRSSNMMDYLNRADSVVRFDAPWSSGFNGTPVNSSTITFPPNLGDLQNPTRASEGYMFKMLHNSAVEPTVSAPAGVQVIKDSGEYQTGVDNIFYFICHKNASDKVVKVSYTITQNQI